MIVSGIEKWGRWVMSSYAQVTPGLVNAIHDPDPYDEAVVMGTHWPFIG